MWTRNPWIWALWGAGLGLVLIGVVIWGSAEPPNPFLPIEGRTQGEAQAARGVALIEWGALVTLAAAVVTALLWQMAAGGPSQRVGEREQPEHHRAED